MTETKNSSIKTKKTISKISGSKKIDRFIKSKAAAFIAAAFLIIFLIAMKSAITGSYTKRTAVFSDETSKKTYIAADGKLLSDTVDGELTGTPVHSCDGKTTAFLTYTKKGDSSYYTLYAVKNRKLIRITNNVSSSFKLSLQGNAVCFTDREGSLRLNSISEQAGSVIAESADEYCISPDGKTVIFSSYDESGLSYSLRCYRRGSVTEAGTGLIPAGVDNNAENIYACDMDFKTLYSVSSDGKKKNKISELAGTNIMFNSDCSQIIFTSDSGTYICFSGSVRKLVSPAADASPVFPDGCEPIITNEKKGIKIYPADSFTDMYYFSPSQKTLSYVNSNCARIDISNEAESAVASSDLKYIYFTDTAKSLYMIKNKKDPKCIKNEVYDFEISNNGKYYVFTNLSGQTVFAKGQKTFFTAENVKFRAITLNNACLYIPQDSQNSLYKISKSGKTKSVSDYISSISIDKASSSVIYFETNKADGSNGDVCKIID